MDTKSDAVRKNNSTMILNASLISTGKRDELSTACNPKVMSRCLSTPDATSLHHCLKKKQLKLIVASLVRIPVFSIMHS